MDSGGTQISVRVSAEELKEGRGSTEVRGSEVAMPLPPGPGDCGGRAFRLCGDREVRVWGLCGSLCQGRSGIENWRGVGICR